ncbi:MAG: DUF2127 domain-containing protein [Verrucomicrobia bacterium]|nr:DUF2127 domain-containing protein [Verrucomicrobiota bacterium]MDE3098984.1 DUF2127 domain-containing protein [Verrucomicrobiota bacterium]
MKGKRRAPTFYFIIAAKLLKGIVALALAVGFLKLARQDLPTLFAQLVEGLKLDPENRFLAEISIRLKTVTAASVRAAALGTFLYSMLSLVEGVGLVFRVPWAGWLTIGESAFFIPIEVHELVIHPHWYLAGILAFNVLIVLYLYLNRQRLFRHHH